MHSLHNKILIKTVIGELPYTTQPSKYGRYNYIQKRTMWTKISRAVPKEMPVTPPVPSRGFASHIFHVNRKKIEQDTQAQEQGLLPKEKEEALQAVKTLVQGAKGHPFNGIQDGTNIRIWGKATHAPKAPKSEGGSPYKMIKDEKGKEPLYNAGINAEGKSVDVPAQYFIKGRKTGETGSIEEQRIEGKA